MDQNPEHGARAFDADRLAADEHDRGCREGRAAGCFHPRDRARGRRPYARRLLSDRSGGGDRRKRQRDLSAAHRTRRKRGKRIHGACQDLRYDGEIRRGLYRPCTRHRGGGRKPGLQHVPGGDDGRFRIRPDAARGLRDRDRGDHERSRGAGSISGGRQ